MCPSPPNSPDLPKSDDGDDEDDGEDENEDEHEHEGSFKKKSLLRRSLYLGCGFCDQGLEHILVVTLVGKRLADNDGVDVWLIEVFCTMYIFDDQDNKNKRERRCLDLSRSRRSRR